MIDLLDAAEARIREAGHGTTYFRRLDSSAKREGIVIRRLPATVTGRYFDGRKDVRYYFQVIVKRRSEEQAMEECEAIADLLEAADLSSASGSYAITSCVVDSEPQELELNEANMHAWKTVLMASITTRERGINA